MLAILGGAWQPGKICAASCASRDYIDTVAQRPRRWWGALSEEK